MGCTRKLKSCRGLTGSRELIAQGDKKLLLLWSSSRGSQYTHLKPFSAATFPINLHAMNSTQKERSLAAVLVSSRTCTRDIYKRRSWENYMYTTRVPFSIVVDFVRHLEEEVRVHCRLSIIGTCPCDCDLLAGCSSSSARREVAETILP